MLFARMLAFLLSYTLPVLLVRRLSVDEFGLYKQIFLVVGTSLLILPLGFQMSVYYFLPRERERRQQVAFNVVLFNLTGGGLACLMLMLRPSLLAAILNSTGASEYAPLVGLIILSWVSALFLESLMIANAELKLATVLIVMTQLGKAIVFVGAVLASPSVKAIVVAALVVGGLQMVVALCYLCSRFPGFWQRFEWPLMRKQLAYGLPLGVGAMLSVAYPYVDDYFVSYRFGAARFAIYSIGCFNIPLVDLINTSIGSVMIPRVIELQRFGRPREITELSARMMRKLAAIYLPLYVFLLVSRREFITVLFTSRYLASQSIFSINLTLILLAIIWAAVDPILRAHFEHRYLLLRIYGGLLVVHTAALWWVTGHLGLTAAIATTVGMSLLITLILAFRVGRTLGVTWHDVALLKDVGKLTVAAAAAGFVTAALRLAIVGARPLIVLVLCNLGFLAIYLAAVLLLGVPTTEERERLGRRIAGFQVWTRWKPTTDRSQ